MAWHRMTCAISGRMRVCLARLMRRRGNLRIAAVAHDLANTVNVDAAFLASVAEVQRGLGKGESLFEQTLKALPRRGRGGAVGLCSWA